MKREKTRASTLQAGSCHKRSEIANFYENAIRDCNRPTFVPFGFFAETMETLWLYTALELIS